MKSVIYLGLLVSFIGLIPRTANAQEKPSEINVEDSAEVFLEEYSDDFQENFFEGLKQKGIENYDKAINLFLECKRLDSDNIVVDHELAKAYFSDKQYGLARDYGIEALVSEPENPWFLETLVKVLQNQGSSINEVKSSIPFDNVKLQENLALIYFKNKNYDGALAILKKLKKSPFVDDLASKITDFIKKSKENSQKVKFATVDTRAADPLFDYKVQIEGLIQTNNYSKLKQVSEDALDTYPSQPFFYYAQGYALNKTSKYKNAIEILEAALDYLIDDVGLANKIYTELVEAYNSVNNSVKANMYLRKIKPGF